MVKNTLTALALVLAAPAFAQEAAPTVPETMPSQAAAAPSAIPSPAEAAAEIEALKRQLAEERAKNAAAPEAAVPAPAKKIQFAPGWTAQVLHVGPMPRPGILPPTDVSFKEPSVASVPVNGSSFKYDAMRKSKGKLADDQLYAYRAEAFLNAEDAGVYTFGTTITFGEWPKFHVSLPCYMKLTLEGADGTERTIVERSGVIDPNMGKSITASGGVDIDEPGSYRLTWGSYCPVAKLADRISLELVMRRPSDDALDTPDKNAIVSEVRSAR